MIRNNKLLNSMVYTKVVFILDFCRTVGKKRVVRIRFHAYRLKHYLFRAYGRLKCLAVFRGISKRGK